MLKVGMQILGIVLSLNLTEGCVTSARKTEATCKWNGKVYEAGSNIQKDCNECNCLEGKWLCTLMGCDEPPN